MSPRERRSKPSAPTVGDPAEMLARLAGVQRLLVFPDGHAEGARAFGMEAPADPKAVLREGVAAVDIARIARLARAELGESALGALAAAANVSHLVIVRLGAKAGPPLAIAALGGPSDDPAAEDAEVILRLSAAAVLVGAAIASTTGSGPGEGDTYLTRQLQQVTATLDAEGTLRAANGSLEQLSGLPMHELLGRSVEDLFELRCRSRLKRSIDALRSKPSASGVFCVSRADGSRVPVLVRAISARVAREQASLWAIRALSPDEAAREIVGRVATAIFPAAGTTIRADRLLSETADALDLRLVALATTAPADRAPTIELAAGPAVTRLDAISKLEAPTPWHEVFEKGSPLEIPDLSVVPAESARVLDDLGFRAFLGLPVRAPDGAPLGVLLVLADTPRGFLPFEVEALRIVAEFLATDLDRRRAEASLERRAAELASLLDATRDLASERDP
ncbi:MAG TPA: GAF domain-containing protein, partial [Planctomycetota bacterium]|nr:GAF domain-containing protein [Planctomycetota bacterium]